MIVDTSALVALLLEERSHRAIAEAVRTTTRPGIGAPCMLEAGMVLEGRLGRVGRSLLARSVVELDLEVLPFGEEHWPVAIDAFSRYGKGRHPAALDFGDCMAYATARLAGEPLLCVGDDFPQTDLELVPLG